jgi:VanZ family protein
MIMIFSLSSLHAVVLAPSSQSDFIVHKALHLIEYATLYFLIFRALYGTKSAHRPFIWAFLITILYACSDEFHQIFVPTRTPAIRDVIIDLFGMIIMYIIIKANFKTVKKLL